MQVIDKYGLEIELVDIPRNIGLPANCYWNREEKTLVNSDGSWVNVSKKRDVDSLGGEINTVPTKTIVEQLDIFKAVLDYFPMANINYRCNLHVHISLMPEFNILQVWQNLVEYFYENYDYIMWFTMDRFKRPNEMSAGLYNKMIEVNIPIYVKDALMRSKNKEEFIQSFFIKTDGLVNKRVPFRRSYVNFHALSTHGTIEFRNFWATKELSLVEGCLRSIDKCISSLFTGAPYNWGSYKYPTFIPYEHNLELGFKQTKNER